MRNIFFFFILLSICCCSNNQTDKEVNNRILTDKDKKIDTVAVFIDSINIGNQRNNKIVLLSIVINDTIPKTKAMFFSKKNEKWDLRNSFEDDHWHPSDILPTDITDFNNDGYKDFKYSKGTGARGGNSIDNLLIYNKSADTLSYVRNSNDYPNLYYNQKTNSILSYILTGSVETIFLRIDSNNLKPFASIDQSGKKVTVTEIDKKGKSKITLIDSSGKYPDLAKFINFKPLEYEK